jgi:hypothetical protein
MYKIIGADQKEYGPVSADQIRQWILENRSNGQTRVLPEGATAWVELGVLPEFADALASRTAQAALPSPTPIPIPISLTGEILSREVEVNLGSCLSRSWNLLKNNFAFLLGVNLVAMLVTFGIFLLTGVMGLIVPVPFLGQFLFWSCFAVLKAGTFWVILKLARGETATIGDLFAGLKRNAGHLLLVGFLTGLGVSVGTCCCFIPGLALVILWIFALLIVIDLRMGAWDAMELSRKVVTKQLWGMVALVIVIGLIQLVVPTILGLISMAAIGSTLAPMATEWISHLNLPPGIEIPENFIPFMAMGASFVVGYFVGNLFNMIVITPFSSGAVVYAYEDLIGKKPQPAG